MEMVRYCPVCDDEFRPDVTTCSDCGGGLLLQEEGVGAWGVPAAAAQGASGASREDWRTALDAVPASGLLPVRTFDSLSDLEPAIASFADRQLPSRVLVQNGRYILLIRPESLGEAQAALHGAFVDEDDSPDPGFDAEAGRYANCPACQTRLPESKATCCPECGLELRDPGGSVSVPETE